MKRCAAFASSLLLTALALCASGLDARIIVEEVTPGAGGHTAGITVGDVLLSWNRAGNPPANTEPATGEFVSPFDLIEVEQEQSPRGIVTIFGLRCGEPFSAEMPFVVWGISTRPQMDPELLRLYEHGKFELASWKKAAELAAQKDARMETWLWSIVCDVHAQNLEISEAESACRKSMDAAQESPGVQAIIERKLGDMYSRQKDFSRAEAAYVRVLELVGSVAPESLAVANSLYNLCWVAGSRGDLKAARSFCERALAAYEKQIPDGWAVAQVAAYLGNLIRILGDLPAAEEKLKRALALWEKLAPESLDFAWSLNNLGLVAWERGDLHVAEEYHSRALAIKEGLNPGSLEVSSSLNNLGLVAWERGHLSQAEDFFQRSLAIRERLDPESVGAARALNNLGLVAWSRGDLKTAEDWLWRSLGIWRKIAPEDKDTAMVLTNLGLIAWERGQLAKAEELYANTLSVFEKIAPVSTQAAVVHKCLAQVARDRGDLGKAEEQVTKALEILAKLAPESPMMADCFSTLGSIAEKASDPARAEQNYRNALSIHSKVTPGSTREAKAHHDLGNIYRKTGRRKEALEAYRLAIEALESQKGKLGGTEEARTGFAAEYEDYYRDYIDLLLESNQSAEAFHVLERSRARSLLSMLAERDLVIAADIPEELELDRKRMNAEYDRTQAALAQLSPSRDRQKMEELLARLRDTRAKQEEIADKIRKASPHYASLQYPQPVDLPKTRKILDPGTALLAFSVGKNTTHIFLIAGEKTFQVHTVDMGKEELSGKVERFRYLIRGARKSKEALAELALEGNQLYRQLVAPAETVIEKSRRVLIVPDGPLHMLPFSALARTSDAGPIRYLVEWKPFHVIVSVTVYAELQKPGSAKSTSMTLAAFGDPEYSSSPDENTKAAQDAEVRSVLRSGFDLIPLPGTREEVNAITELLGDKTIKYLGKEATEEHAKALHENIRYIHFACHGLLDTRFPLNSALALSIPKEFQEGKENGLLQAWELFERIRINADLVTLSACETGLGKEMGGEGLVGLTRAFQYAGARSVLASLWSVSDESTAELMKHLYAYIKEGKSNDEALRSAQMDMIREPIPLKNGDTLDASHPFHWAAFQLIGNWQ